MTGVTVSAPAKINLTLDVLGARPDGYHAIRSVMQTLTLCDDVSVRRAPGQSRRVRCTWADASFGELPQDAENLAWRAADAFFRAVPLPAEGLEISISKRIPSQAGLGGGSSDAAAVLRALNRLFGEPLSRPGLCLAAQEVGSDVPFLISGGTAEATGRGEVLAQLPDAAGLTVVLCRPDFSVSTAELYRAVDAAAPAARPDSCAMRRALCAMDAQAVGRALGNVFAPLVAQEHPEIEQICSTMCACGAAGAQMTGTGSVVFGVFPEPTQADDACRTLSGMGFWTVRTETSGAYV